jgi:hypothetical protein
VVVGILVSGMGWLLSMARVACAHSIQNLKESTP